MHNKALYVLSVVIAAAVMFFYFYPQQRELVESEVSEAREESDSLTGEETKASLAENNQAQKPVGELPLQVQTEENAPLPNNSETSLTVVSSMDFNLSDETFAPYVAEKVQNAAYETIYDQESTLPLFIDSFSCDSKNCYIDMSFDQQTSTLAVSQFLRRVQPKLEEAFVNDEILVQVVSLRRDENLTSRVSFVVGSQ